MNFSRRISVLRRRMAASGLPALLVTHQPDVRWLCGFTGSNAALAITRRAVRLFTDGRYIAQAASETHGAKIEIVPTAAAVSALQFLAAQVATLNSPQPGATVGFDPIHTTVAELEKWRAALPGPLRRKLLVAAPPLVESLRRLKDEDELALMAHAARLGDQLFDQMLGLLHPGLTEVAVAAELEFRARNLGAEAMSFETIVASGPRSALPHGRASLAKLPRRGFITLDFGVILSGYCSDMTRTVCLGKPSARERQVYEAVLEAQQSAVNAVIAGASCSDVDEAARSVLRETGMADAFSHSTGHGVGIEIHEGPRIGAGQKETLAPGMVITIEPGVYFQGEFGVRIEDMVHVTRTGGEVLTHSPKALIEL